MTMTTMVAKVKDMGREYMFTTDTDECDSIRDMLRPHSCHFDSFFVIVGDGDYEEIWGMEGTTPWTGNYVTRLR
jgi:hypothetical protein